MSERAPVFDNGPDFDVTQFSTKKPKPADKTIPIEAIKAVSEAAQFPSREPVPAEGKKTPKATTEKPRIRRYRTGRDVQFNLKCKAETRNAFYDIADQQGWVLGETLERAVAALKEKITPKTSRGDAA